MKNKMAALCLIGLLALSACSTSARRLTYNTLASVGLTTKAAFDGYLDLVVAEKVSTNSVPKVAKAYDTFQGVYSVAIAAAQLGSNAVATASVIDSSAKVLETIKEAKEAK